MTSIRRRTWTGADGEAKAAWLVDYKDQTGKRRAKSFARKKDAEQWRDKAMWEVREGTHTVDRESVTVAAAADIWIARAEAEGCERSTVKSYREIAKLHIVPEIGATKLSRLTKPGVIAFRDKLVATRSRAMAGKAVRALSSIIGIAQERGLVAQNVARGVSVVKKSRDREPVVIPTRAELKALIAAATETERPLILTLIATGLRSSEIRGLRWSDIDLKAATISVEQRADQWGEIGPPKSAAGRRTIPIPPKLVTVLKAWKLQSPPSPIGLAFPTSTGTPQRHNNLLRRMFIPLQLRAGVTEARQDAQGEPVVDEDGKPVLTGRYGLHALRHAAASGWITNRIDLKRLQVWIGHENIQLTLDTYGHLMADERRDAELARLASRGLF